MWYLVQVEVRYDGVTEEASDLLEAAMKGILKYADEQGAVLNITRTRIGTITDGAAGIELIEGLPPQYLE